MNGVRVTGKGVGKGFGRIKKGKRNCHYKVSRD
jgi:hypothetical protein